MDITTGKTQVWLSRYEMEIIRGALINYPGPYGPAAGPLKPFEVERSENMIAAGFAMVDVIEAHLNEHPF